MVNYLLKKSYQRKNFKEIEFDDLWNKDGVFTTMWIYNKPPKILFFKTHIDNLIKSLKAYKIYEKGIKSKILKLINENIDKTKSYNHLLRVALNKKTISISLRDRVKLNNKFGIKLVNYERVKPEYKNLKYKINYSQLSGESHILERALFAIWNSEYEVSEILYNKRKEGINFFRNSFDYISAFDSNAAIVHYKAPQKKSLSSKNRKILLIDSGAHYLEGTTDITRVIKIGKKIRNFRHS